MNPNIRAAAPSLSQHSPVEKTIATPEFTKEVQTEAGMKVVGVGLPGKLLFK